MIRRVFRSALAKKRGLIAVLAALLAAGTALGIAVGGGAASAAPAARAQTPAEASGLGQLTGLLPSNKLTLESTIQVNLSNETARLPVYPGIAYAGTSHAEKV